MRIGIDVRMWDEKGVGRYIRGLVKSLVTLNSEDTYVLFCLHKHREELLALIPKNWDLVVVDIRWYTLKEQLLLPGYFYAANLDLLHVPHFNVPILYRKKFVVTIHDLTHFTFKMKRASRLPGWLYKIKHCGYDVVFRNAVQQSTRIFTVSHYVKNDMAKRFASIQDKTVVTYEAADSCAVVSSDWIIRTLNDYNITRRYFYYIGNAHPHKNLEFLLQSFQKFRKLYPDAQLVLSGEDTYFWPRLKKWAVYQHLSDNVVFTGYVDDIAKDTLLRGAVGYVFPSLSEGFGLPVLEAMQCSCPVIAARATSLPEVGGDAALYFAPDVCSELVQCLVKLFTSEDERKKLIVLGLEQAATFSWQRMTMETLAQYHHGI